MSPALTTGTRLVCHTFPQRASLRARRDSNSLPDSTALTRYWAGGTDPVGYHEIKVQVTRPRGEGALAPRLLPGPAAKLSTELSRCSVERLIWLGRADKSVFHDVNARIAELCAPGLFWQGTLPGEGLCSKPRAMRPWLRRQASAFESGSASTSLRASSLPHSKG